MTTVVVADDHAATRDAVRAMLEDAAFDVVGEAADAETTVAVTSATRPDICLIDVHMPGDGVVAARRIARQFPETTVVMLTASSDDGDLFDAVRAGAAGYLLKDIDPERLPHALRAAAAGEAALPRTLVRALMREFRGQEARRLGARPGARLTEREWEILGMLSRGMTTDEIADDLFVSPVTVRTHIAATLHKLRVGDRAAAVRLFRASR
ncbi:MAG TPA: response regulator transcription factor [Frankiaceae bacterium]|nr:response regulator transcription factor [Frankiaceae bacterium]